MPCDATPRILRGSIVSSGSFAPIVATAIVCPAATFVAAVAIVSGARRADVDARDQQPVGVGMFLDACDPAGDDAADLRALLDRGDRKAEHREAIGDRFAYRSGARRTRAASLSERASLRRSTQLREKVRVAVDEPANVVDFVSRQADALDAEAECPAGVALGIVADFAQHVGMHHPGTAELDPSRTSAHGAARRASRIAPVPLQRGQVVSTSALGSVNGKYEGRKRTLCSAPKSSRQSPVSIPLRWPK